MIFIDDGVVDLIPTSVGKLMTTSLPDSEMEISLDLMGNILPSASETIHSGCLRKSCWNPIGRCSGTAMNNSL